MQLAATETTIKIRRHQENAMSYRKLLMGLVLGTWVFAFTGIAHVEAQAAQFSIGAGAGVAPDYEGSDDYQIIPMLFGKATSDSGLFIEFRGLKLKANLIPDKVARFGPVVNYRFGRKHVDNDQVDELKNVDDAFEVGAFAGVEINSWNLSIEFLQDITDGHEGYLTTLSGGYRWAVTESISLMMGASTTYASEDYMSSFFGIDAQDAARSGLSTFNADAGFKDVAGSLGAGYRFTQNWSVRAMGKYTRLIGDAANSPVTDDVGNANQYFGSLTLVFSF